MIGAIVGDITGSVYERRQIKTKDFSLSYPQRTPDHRGGQLGSHWLFLRAIGSRDCPMLSKSRIRGIFYQLASGAGLTTFGWS